MIYELTICIPTYNRGKRALELVNSILPNLKENWSVMVLNNNSVDDTKFYDQIETLAKKHIQVEYIKHKINCQFYGNFKSCLTYPNSKYVLLISDEDFVNFDELENIVNILNQYPLIGACRTSVTPAKDLKEIMVSITMPNKFFKAGEEALNKFCFTNNYISGIIYNLENIKKTNMIDILEKNLLSHKAYPHLYFDLLVSSKFDVMMTSKVSVFEGNPVYNHKDASGTKITLFDHIGPYGYGERVNQFFSLRDGIFDAVKLLELNDSNTELIVFLNIYFKLVEKYFYLIGMCNMPAYKRNHIEESLLKESFFYTCAAGVFAYPQVQPFKEVVLEALSAIYKKYK